MKHAVVRPLAALLVRQAMASDHAGLALVRAPA